MIVFFDGVCGLCNAAVDFLLAHDRRGRLQFAPLQGSTAAARLSPSDIAALDSLVVLDDEKIYRKSDAVLIALRRLGGGWALLAGAVAPIPRFARDFIYDLIAKRRYRLFGRRETCRLPSVEERTRFLD